MKLQILVPQYNENDSIVQNLLDSLNSQQNIDFNDFEVIIMNDGSDIHLSESLLNRYRYNIKYILGEHRGVSGTRNALLDAATADYIMYCDADDMFYNIIGLFLIFGKIEKGFDIFLSKIVEETKVNDRTQIAYLKKDYNPVFVHGKVYRRQFLIDENIRWNDKLTIHEDSYFNMLATKLSKNTEYCPVPFYLWKWRDESVCRNDLLYIYKTYPQLFDSSEACIDELLKHNHDEDAEVLSTSMLINSFCTLQEKDWNKDDILEYKEKMTKRFKEYFQKFKPFYDRISLEKKQFIYSNIMKKRKLKIPLEDFENFLQNLSK